MDYANISSAFRERLRSVVGAGARITFENTPAVNQQRPYYKAVLLPGEDATPTFGTLGVQRANGVFQVSVVTDAGTGEAQAAQLVDALLNGFRRGLTFAAGTNKIVVEKSWRSPALPGVDTYTIPVSIRYWCDISPAT